MRLFVLSYDGHPRARLPGACVALTARGVRGRHARRRVRLLLRAAACRLIALALTCSCPAAQARRRRPSHAHQPGGGAAAPGRPSRRLRGRGRALVRPYARLLRLFSAGAQPPRRRERSVQARGCWHRGVRNLCPDPGAGALRRARQLTLLRALLCCAEPRRPGASRRRPAPRPRARWRRCVVRHARQRRAAGGKSRNGRLPPKPRGFLAPPRTVSRMQRALRHADAPRARRRRGCAGLRKRRRLPAPCLRLARPRPARSRPRRPPWRRRRPRARRPRRPRADRRPSRPRPPSQPARSSRTAEALTTIGPLRRTLPERRVLAASLTCLATTRTTTSLLTWIQTPSPLQRARRYRRVLQRLPAAPRLRSSSSRRGRRRRSSSSAALQRRSRLRSSTRSNPSLHLRCSRCRAAVLSFRTPRRSSSSRCSRSSRSSLLWTARLRRHQQMPTCRGAASTGARFARVLRARATAARCRPS